MTNDEARRNERNPKLEGRRSRMDTAKRLRRIAKGWTPQAAYPGGECGACAFVDKESHLRWLRHQGHERGAGQGS